MKTTKIKFRKSHPDFAYFTGDIAELSNDHVAKLLNSGHVIILPEDDDESKKNPLPVDLPGRTQLFDAGYDTLEKVKVAGESLLDAGISNANLKKIKKYLEAAVIVPVNALPEDLPARDLLFKADYDTIEKIKEAAEKILEIEGITEEEIDGIKNYAGLKEE